jgi:Na+/proline symporter
MIYRVINPSAPPEQAYILACALVLPPGMVGLLLAAMFSSAASYIDGEVNVYAGSVTNDIYKTMIAPHASEKHLLLVGRINSFLIGGVIILIALLVPHLGGAEKIVLTITGLLVVAMVLPLLWGLYFGKIGQSSIWWCTGTSVAAAILVKLVIPEYSDNAIL